MHVCRTELFESMLMIHGRVYKVCLKSSGHACLATKHSTACYPDIGCIMIELSSKASSRLGKLYVHACTMSIQT